MKYVQTISAVSGGAIIAAYYATEMEKRLRRRANGPLDDESIDVIRLEIFEEIVACLFRGLDHNMRSRALVFMPFYHPFSVPYVRGHEAVGEAMGRRRLPRPHLGEPRCAMVARPSPWRARWKLTAARTTETPRGVDILVAFEGDRGLAYNGWRDLPGGGAQS